MWVNDRNFPEAAELRGFYTPPAKWKSRPSAPYSSLSPTTWMSEKKNISSPDDFHVIHKVPAGDSPYVKAKHVQLIEKDPGRAVSLFWKAINSGDRVDSALKDMAVVMKQLNRSDEAIEAIKSFRNLCSLESQESLDNVLVELYKRSGRLEEQIQILQLKLKRLEQGNAFGGKRVKLARSQGKKIHITVEQEYARLLGNLGWAYLQQNDYRTAEEHYRKALSIEPDRNKQCNLAICLMCTNRITEARFLLQAIQASAPEGQMDESYAKSFERASQLLAEIGSQPVQYFSSGKKDNPGGSANFLAFTPYKEQNYERTRSSEGTGYSLKTAYTPLIPARGLPNSPFTQPRRGSTLLDSGNWRKGTCGDEQVSRSHRRLQFERPADFRSVRDSKRTCCEIQRQHGSMNMPPPKDSTLIDKVCDRSILDPKAAAKTTSGRTSETSSAGDGDVNHNKGAADDNEVEQDFPIYRCKKSWADMVEEDEQEELMNDVLGKSELYPSFDSFVNENVNLNMVAAISETTHKSPAENLSSKFQSLNLDEGTADVSLSTKQSSARRSLVFYQHRQQEPAKRSTRLKVFQDITHVPESPRA